MNFLNIFSDLKKWFTHYPLYKLIALILAIVVYFYVNGEFK
jgi:YbbR domain-containing protein